MTCQRISTPGGLRGVVCTRGPARGQRCGEPIPGPTDARGRSGPPTVCGAPAVALCDWPESGGRTCSRPLCDAHCKRIADGIDYCGDHAHAREQRIDACLTLPHEEAPPGYAGMEPLAREATA